MSRWQHSTLKAGAVAGTLALSSACAWAQVPQAQDAPVRGGIFTYAISQGEPPHLDCQTNISINAALRLAPHYSTLVKANPADPSQLVGDLARNWTVSADGRTLTFKLNGGVQFHNGTPLTAADVRASLNRIRQPPKGVPSPQQAAHADVESVEAPDPETVVIRLSAPNPAYLKLLANPRACILSEALLKSDPDYPAKKVMGSGPFRFVRYSPGTEWVGERFDKYHVAGRPYLDGFRALSVTSAAANNALLAGQVMTDFRGLPVIEATRIKSSRGDKVRLHEPTVINLLLLLQLNVKKPDLADVRVRRAIALSIDHWSGEKLVERLTGTNAPGGLLRPGSEFARTPEQLSTLPGFRRDIEAARAEARKLLAEAGKTNLTLRFLNRRPFPYVGVFVIDQLRQIGITVTQEQVEDPQYLARREAGDYDLVLGAMPDFDDDPTLQWANFTSASKNRENWSNTDDPKIDSYYLQQKQATQPQQRKAILQEAEAYMLNQAYVVPFFWGRRALIMASEVGGYVPTHSNWVGMDLAHLWLRKSP